MKPVWKWVIGIVVVLVVVGAVVGAAVLVRDHLAVRALAFRMRAPLAGQPSIPGRNANPLQPSQPGQSVRPFGNPYRYGPGYGLRGYGTPGYGMPGYGMMGGRMLPPGALFASFAGGVVAGWGTLGFVVLLVLLVIWLTRRNGASAPAAVPAPAQPVLEMRDCVSCGRRIQADWRNCPYCGKKQ